MKPPGSLPAENIIPVEVPGFNLGSGGIAPIGRSDRPAQSVSPLGEVQTVSDCPTDSVKVFPPDEVSRYSALENQVFEKTADFVLDEGRCHGGFHPEAASKTASDVVFPSAFPGIE